MDTTRGHASLRRSRYCERGCFHPHLHCVVPAGGFAPSRKRWVWPKRSGFSCQGRALVNGCRSWRAVRAGEPGWERCPRRT
ncbi:MAG: transposase [Bryobacteraceae bacterium]